MHHHKDEVINVHARIDRFLGPDDADEQLWAEMGEAICGALLSGRRTAVMANGQTRAGKTTAIQMLVSRTAGEVAEWAARRMVLSSSVSSSSSPSGDGAEMAMSVSMVEDYNDLVYDLLAAPGDAAKNKGKGQHQTGQGHTHGHAAGGGMKVEEVVGLYHPSSSSSSSTVESASTSGDTTTNRSQSHQAVTSVRIPWSSSSSFVAQLTEVIERGTQARTTRATKMNSASSWSHAILVLRFHTSSSLSPPPSSCGLVAFVDLAGNESLQSSQGGDYGNGGGPGGDAAARETISINKNLQALSRVLTALARRSGGSSSSCEHASARPVSHAWP